MFCHLNVLLGVSSGLFRVSRELSFRWIQEYNGTTHRDGSAYSTHRLVHLSFANEFPTALFISQYSSIRANFLVAMHTYETRSPPHGKKPLHSKNRIFCTVTHTGGTTLFLSHVPVKQACFELFSLLLHRHCYLPLNLVFCTWRINIVANERQGAAVRETTAAGELERENSSHDCTIDPLNPFGH